MKNNDILRNLNKNQSLPPLQEFSIQSQLQQQLQQQIQPSQQHQPVQETPQLKHSLKNQTSIAQIQQPPLSPQLQNGFRNPSQRIVGPPVNF